MPSSLYIACTQSGGGKTIIAAGLCQVLRARGLRVGYFKPVGIAAAPPEAGPPVDDDATFVAGLLGLEDDLADICPLVQDEDMLHDVFEASGVDPLDRVAAAYERICRDKDIVICEGLGEIWQGRFLRASGADVVARLDLKTLLVARFAGSRLLDDVLYVKEVLKQRLLGVVFSQVPESRLEVVSAQYVPLLSQAGIETYGVLANQPQLTAVSVQQLVTALHGTYLAGEALADELVETYMIGAMNPSHAQRYFERTANKAVVVGGDRTKIILSALDTPTVLIVLTGSYMPDPAVLTKARERGVALVSIAGDTVSAADTLRHLFAHARVRERSKVDLMTELLGSALDLDRLLTDLEA